MFGIAFPKGYDPELAAAEPIITQDNSRIEMLEQQNSDLKLRI